jgi:hypothetical protein
MLAAPMNQSDTGKPKANATARAVETPKRLAKALTATPDTVTNNMAPTGCALSLDSIR